MPPPVPTKTSHLSKSSIPKPPAEIRITNCETGSEWKGLELLVCQPVHRAGELDITALPEEAGFQDKKTLIRARTLITAQLSWPLVSNTLALT